MCGGGGGADKNVGRAAREQAALAREQLEWFKTEYAKTAGDRQSASDRANQISDFQMGQMREQDARADQAYAYEQKYTRPIQERMATEALNYDTPERRAAAAQAASADVQMNASNQSNILSRNLARSGINPASAQSVNAQKLASLQTAANTVSAMNGARTQVEQIGYGRMADAINMGQGVSQRGVQASSMAQGAGTAAIGAQGAGLGALTSGLGGVQGAYGTAGQMLNASGNLYAQNAQAANQASAANGQMVGGLASAAMTAAVVY